MVRPPGPEAAAAGAAALLAASVGGAPGHHPRLQVRILIQTAVFHTQTLAKKEQSVYRSKPLNCHRRKSLSPSHSLPNGGGLWSVGLGISVCIIVNHPIFFTAQSLLRNRWWVEFAPQEKVVAISSETKKVNSLSTSKEIRPLKPSEVVEIQARVALLPVDKVSMLFIEHFPLPLISPHRSKSKESCKQKTMARAFLRALGAHPRRQFSTIWLGSNLHYFSASLALVGARIAHTPNCSANSLFSDCCSSSFMSLKI